MRFHQFNKVERLLLKQGLEATRDTWDEASKDPNYSNLQEADELYNITVLMLEELEAASDLMSWKEIQ